VHQDSREWTDDLGGRAVSEHDGQVVLPEPVVVVRARGTVVIP
jgi:hypothetical protein